MTVGGVTVRPTWLGTFLVVTALLAARGAGGTIDPVAAGLVVALLGATVVVGAAVPIVAVALVRARVESNPSDLEVARPGTIGVRVERGIASLELAWDLGGGWGRDRGAEGGGLAVVPRSRGVFDELALLVRCPSPLGVLAVTRRIDLTLPHPLHVAPAPTPCPWTPSPVRRSADDGAGPIAAAVGDTVRGVRPYVTGDPAHLVHWPSSARAGSLVVRELEPPVTWGVAVVVDLNTGPFTREEIASRAAGLVASVVAAGGALVICASVAGRPVTRPIARPVDAARLLAAAGPGAIGDPPAGWPVERVGA